MTTPEFRVLDSHVNLGTGAATDDPIKSDISVESILSLMGEAAVERSIVFPVSNANGYDRANEQIARAVEERPGQLIGFGRIRTKAASPAPWDHARVAPVARPARRLLRRVSDRFPAARPSPPGAVRADSASMVRRCFTEHGLQGIKMHPIEDGYPTTEVLEILEEHRKPILLHTGSGVSLRRIENEIAAPFSFPVILAHMGGYPASRSGYERAISLAERHDNVFINTSFVFYHYILEDAIKRCPTKVIFGSDAPGVHPSTAVSAIASTRVPDDLKQRVLHDNMVDVLALAKS